MVVEAVLPSKRRCNVLRSTSYLIAVELKFGFVWVFKSVIAAEIAVSLTILWVIKDVTLAR